MVDAFFGGFKRGDTEGKRNKENLAVKHLRDGWVIFEDKIKTIRQKRERFSRVRTREEEENGCL